MLFTEPEEKSEKNSPPSQADLLNLASGFPNAEIVDEIATVDSQSLNRQILGKDTFSIRLPFPNIWRYWWKMTNLATAAGHWVFFEVGADPELTLRTSAKLEDKSVYKWRSPLTPEQRLLNLNVVDVTHNLI